MDKAKIIKLEAEIKTLEARHQEKALKRDLLTSECTLLQFQLEKKTQFLKGLKNG